MTKYTTRFGRVLPLLAPLALVACSGDDFQPSSTGGDTFADKVLGNLPPARLDTPDHIVSLASSASAPNVFAISMFALGIVQTSNDPACPKKTEGAGSVRYDGGCTDKNGTQWFGSVEITGSQASSDVSYEDFGQKKQVDCAGVKKDSTLAFTGTARYGAAASGFEFTVDLRGEFTGVDEDHCQPALGGVAWDYSGTVAQTGADADGDGQPDDTLWNGSGRMGLIETGVVEASTKGELVSEATCKTEALSGTTELSAGKDVVLITYDGKTDCDETGTVQYSVNGQPKGELEGVKCSASPGSGSGGGLGAALVGALAGFASRRRRRAGSGSASGVLDASEKAR